MFVCYAANIFSLIQIQFSVTVRNEIAVIPGLILNVYEMSRLNVYVQANTDFVFKSNWSHLW